MDKDQIIQKAFCKEVEIQDYVLKHLLVKDKHRAHP